MKILQLCKKFPYPLKDGESIAVTYQSKAFHEFGCEITLLAMNTTKHYTEIGKLPNGFNHYKEIHVTDIDNRVKVLKAFVNLFSSKSYHISRFDSKEYNDKLIALLQDNEYDVIQLETLYLTPYIDTIKQHSNAIVSMRSHNVEFEIWERISANTKFLPKKLYLKYLTKKLKNFELTHINDYDYLVTVTDRDLQKFKKLGYKNGAMASPIGLQVDRYVENTTSLQGKDISFIGSMDWLPNIEGLEWFLKEVWTIFSKQNPEVKFHIAGRNTPKWITNLDLDNVVVHGEVLDALRFMQKYPIMVVPLFSGSGMRVKILEGLALGRVVVSTTVGKEGIEANHGEQIFVADTAMEFVAVLTECIKDLPLMQTVADNAVTLIKDKYDHKVNARKLLEKYKSILLSDADG
ncbi:MAG: glycosyltransferase family 4 protein [Saprospiraceae bacterium]|nr:glycosyltransferase family 4 protein [Saprospiraceae bacterium]